MEDTILFAVSMDTKIYKYFMQCQNNMRDYTTPPSMIAVEKLLQL